VKICDVTECYAESSGGIKTYLHAKRSYLTSVRGWEHVLVVPGARDERDRRGPMVTFRVAGPRVPKTDPYRLLVSVRRVASILREERPDLVEVGSPFLAPWIVRRALASNRPRPPLVAFYHSDVPSTYVEPLAQRLIPGAAPWAVRKTWSYLRSLHSGFAATLVASRHVEQLLLGHGIPRVRRVSLGVDLELFHPRRRLAIVRRSLGMRPGETLLLCAGRLSPEKGVRTLLSAFSRLERGRFRLLVVGDGPLRGELAAAARSVGGVHLLGHVADRRRLAALYASADLFVAPGRHETFGLAALEAQASGVPVVAVRGGSFSEVVAPDAGVLARPDDPADLARAIEAASRSPRDAMGAAGRAHVERHYGWDGVISEIADLYEAVIAQNREGRAA
jgi:alpha-1,6-mannosyltransferase